MELEILDKLQRIQDAHNELGLLYEQFTRSMFYIDIKNLSCIYNEQNECIADLRKTIMEQRNQIRQFSPMSKRDSSGEFRLESILLKHSQLIPKQKSQLDNNTPKTSLLSNIQKKYFVS